MVEGGLGVATKMALVGERRFIWRASNTSQAEKEDQRLWVQDVQETNSKIVVHQASHSQAAHHDCEFSPLVLKGHTLYVSFL